ncbi:hypothetical protein WDU94_006809, partial [Cyamophila willieti]
YFSETWINENPRDQHFFSFIEVSRLRSFSFKEVQYHIFSFIEVRRFEFSFIEVHFALLGLGRDLVKNVRFSRL